MPSYNVLRTIEHNRQIHLPADAGAHGYAPVPEKLPSGAHGRLVPVNASGVIELTEKEAEALAPELHGQIPVFEGKADSIEAAKAREAARLKAEKKK